MISQICSLYNNIGHSSASQADDQLIYYPSLTNPVVYLQGRPCIYVCAFKTEYYWQAHVPCPRSKAQAHPRQAQKEFKTHMGHHHTSWTLLIVKVFVFNPLSPIFANFIPLIDPQSSSTILHLKSPTVHLAWHAVMNTLPLVCYWQISLNV